MRLQLLWLVALLACTKVPLVQVQAGFELADASWFEAEQTLFIFYTVSAEQGIGPESIVEVRYTTDDVVQPWAELAQLTTVHPHVPVSCGPNALCGSTSLKVAKVPREVGVRLRYARDGEMALEAKVAFNAVAAGAPFSHRSFVVYGVLDAANTRAQWRGRHLFPTLRNERATELGLRRAFAVTDERYGTVPPTLLAGGDNPYWYGLSSACPEGLTRTGEAGPIQTSERAIFDSVDLPLAASSSPHLCALSTVQDATGVFTTAAFARKNPEVRPAFPSLKSPIRETTPLRFLLAPCRRTISAPHLEMQEQRLGWTSGDDLVCLDDWQHPGFVTLLSGHFSRRVDEVRAQGRDVVLTLSLHHDELTGQLAGKVEEALDAVLRPESARGSPRLVGAFVLDSYPHSLGIPELKRVVLWCPAKLTLEMSEEDIPDTATRSCPLQPDMPDLVLGPFKFGLLPILPTRAQYLSFIGRYSEAQAGTVTGRSFRAPERTPSSQDVALGEFGVATYFNDEIITAAATDAFSYCASGPWAPVVFRTPLIPTAPLNLLPEVHRVLQADSYGLGLGWDFPFLMRLDYRTVLAGAATAFSLTVPFGIGSNSTAYYGTQIWAQGEFPLDEVLLQCTRYCDHPTFDSAGVYQVSALFRDAYGQACYRPIFPSPGDGGFPRDP